MTEILTATKDRWRNYIKPGFNINVGNILTNYDIAMNHDDKIALDTPVIGQYPHTQVSAMPAEFDLEWFNQSDVEHPDLTSQIKEAFKVGFLSKVMNHKLCLTYFFENHKSLMQ